jgi:hypothetical protein
MSLRRIAVVQDARNLIPTVGALARCHIGLVPLHQVGLVATVQVRAEVQGLGWVLEEGSAEEVGLAEPELACAVSAWHATHIQNYDLSGTMGLRAQHAQTCSTQVWIFRSLVSL